jgi:hypothetical protein
VPPLLEMALKGTPTPVAASGGTQHSTAQHSAAAAARQESSTTRDEQHDTAEQYLSKTHSCQLSQVANIQPGTGSSLCRMHRMAANQVYCQAHLSHKPNTQVCESQQLPHMSHLASWFWLRPCIKPRTHKS